MTRQVKLEFFSILLVELQREVGVPEPASRVDGTNRAGRQEGRHAED